MSDELVTHRVAHGAQRDLHDALRVPGATPLGVLAGRHAEEDEAGHAQRDQALGLDHERVDGVLHLTGHGRDRDRLRRFPPARTAGRPDRPTPRRASATSRRSAGVRRRRRRRRAGNPPGVGADVASAIRSSLRAASPPSGPRSAISSSTMPWADAPQASCTPRSPAARAASAVVGPDAHDVRRRGHRLAGRASRSATNACTAEVAVKRQRVGCGHPVAAAPARARGAARCGRPRRAATSQPFWPSPLGDGVGRQVGAREQDAPGAAGRPRRGTPRRAHAHCARPAPGRARRRPGAARRPWPVPRRPPTHRRGRARRAARP